MYAVSARWGETVRRSHRVTVEASAFQVPSDSRPPVLAPVRLLDWSLTADIAARSRYEVGATIVPPTLDVVDTELGYWLALHATVWHDLSSPERIPLCVARIQEAERDAGSMSWTVQAQSAEVLLSDNSFFLPFTPSAQDRQSAKALMAFLLRQGVGALSVPVHDVSTVDDAQVPPVTWDSDRWAAIDGEDDSLGTALGVDVYAGRDLSLLIADKPPADPAPVWAVDTGVGGVQVSRRESSSRAGVFNRILVEQEPTQTEDGQAKQTKRVRVLVEDRDPASPTYIDGPFGRVTGETIHTPLARTEQIARRIGEERLRSVKGRRKSVSMTAVPNLALDVGDAIEVTTDRGTQVHIIDQISVSGDASGVGAMSCQTRIVREAS